MKTFRLAISVIPILFSLVVDSSTRAETSLGPESISPAVPCLAEAVNDGAQDLPDNCTMDKDLDWKFLNVCVDVTIVCEVEGVGTVTIELDDEWCLFD